MRRHLLATALLFAVHSAQAADEPTLPTLRSGQPALPYRQPGHRRQPTGAEPHPGRPARTRLRRTEQCFRAERGCPGHPQPQRQPRADPAGRPVHPRDERDQRRHQHPVRSAVRTQRHRQQVFRHRALRRQCDRRQRGDRFGPDLAQHGRQGPVDGTGPAQGLQCSRRAGLPHELQQPAQLLDQPAGLASAHLSLRYSRQQQGRRLQQRAVPGLRSCQLGPRRQLPEGSARPADLQQGVAALHRPVHDRKPRLGRRRFLLLHQQSDFGLAAPHLHQSGQPGLRTRHAFVRPEADQQRRDARLPSPVGQQLREKFAGGARVDPVFRPWLRGYQHRCQGQRVRRAGVLDAEPVVRFQLCQRAAGGGGDQAGTLCTGSPAARSAAVVRARRTARFQAGQHLGRAAGCHPRQRLRFREHPGRAAQPSARRSAQRHAGFQPPVA